MRIFEITKEFPHQEKFSLTDQIRRSARSICANIAQAWRKRRYQAAFVSKLNDAESEAAETQTWLEFSLKCDYLKSDVGQELFDIYDIILAKLVKMISNPQSWIIPNKRIKDS